jgi:hypothetical protein
MATCGDARIPQSSSEQARALRAARLLRFVQLSSERARQAVRQDCSFAKKQESPYALLVVVQASNIRRVSRMAPFDLRDGAY